MIKITEEVIETMIASQKNKSQDYFRDLGEEVLQENKILMDAIIENADRVMESLHSYINNDVVRCHIRTNLIASCLATYQVIKAQIEVNELEQSYA